jgi:very-short-patch-repair endonuclease
MERPFAVRPHGGSQLRTDAELAALAARQHGVVARRQLVEIGLTNRRIDRRLAIGRLHAIHRGVFAVGHTRLSREGRWMAAVLAAGVDAALSHRSAAALWGIRATGRARIDVTAPRRMHSRAGVQMHFAALADDEVAVHDGIPVTSPARTLMDLAAVLPRDRLERAINEAERLRLDVGGARSAAPAITRSELEDRFLSLLEVHDLPAPEVNVALRLGDDWIEVDCLWRTPRLIVELDGFDAHGTRAAFERDRARDRRLQAAGWRVARVTWRQLNHDLADELRCLGI